MFPTCGKQAHTKYLISQWSYKKMKAPPTTKYTHLFMNHVSSQTLSAWDKKQFGNWNTVNSLSTESG